MAEASKLRVANFNLKHGATADGYIGRAHRVAEACAELDVDVLALQEVDRYIWRSGFADLYTRAVGDTYTDSYFGKAMGAHLVGAINPGGQYGNALLVKGDIISKQVLPLHGDYIRLPWGKRRNVAPEPRNAILAEVLSESGLMFGAVNTHIGGPHRQRFIGEIVTAAADLPTPCVMLGDFNTGRKNMVKWLAEISSLQIAPRPPELAEGYLQRDHVVVTGFNVTSVSAHWFNFSDHPAIIAELNRAL